MRRALDAGRHHLAQRVAADDQAVERAPALRLKLLLEGSQHEVESDQGHVGEADRVDQHQARVREVAVEEAHGQGDDRPEEESEGEEDCIVELRGRPAVLVDA
ncbi:hypothetical protein D3C78_1522270 [compost metagenome]